MTRIDILVEEQLDAYTSFRAREMFERHNIPTKHQGLFTADGRETRELFTFTWEQLVAFLRAHPERAADCLERSQLMRGMYDKEILERRGDKYVLYSQDHTRPRDERFYDDLFEAAADWFTTQYRMWLHDEV